MSKTLKFLLFIFESVFIFIILMYLTHHNLPKFVEYKNDSTSFMRGFFYIFYMPPLFVLLRLFFLNINRINQPIFLIQNCHLFTILLLGEVNFQDKENLMTLFFFGVVLNLIFYYVDDFCIKKIEKISDK